MRRLDSPFWTSWNKWAAYIFLIFMWGITIKAFVEGNQRITFMYYILPVVTALILWFFSRFKQVTLDGDMLLIRDSRREARVPTSQIKQIYKRNGKMSYISIVFKSETEFGQCVRIFTGDEDQIAEKLRVAMEGKSASVKIHHVSRESASAPHQKEVTVIGWTSEELSGILTDFAELYDADLGCDFDFQVCSHDNACSLITFPHNIPAEQFSFFINYLQYPKNYDLKARSISVVGKALLSPDFHLPDKNLVGKKGVFYIPSNDKDYDVVYVRIGNETYANSFAARHWKKITDSRIPSGVEIG